MPTTIKNIIAGTIAIVILLAAFFIFLHFYKINTKQESHHGGCCCCGGSGGMNGGTGGGSISGPGKFGNLSTIINAQQGVIDINIDPKRNPQQSVTGITVTLSGPPSVGLQLTGYSGSPIGIQAGSPTQNFSYNGNTAVDWYLTWVPGNPTATLTTNTPYGQGQPDYCGTFSFMSGGNPASATVTINSY